MTVRVFVVYEDRKYGNEENVGSYQVNVRRTLGNVGITFEYPAPAEPIDTPGNVRRVTLVFPEQVAEKVGRALIAAADLPLVEPLSFSIDEKSP